MCLQETKLQEGQIDFNPYGYYVYWNSAIKKGYSGTAVFSKIKPNDVKYGLGIEEHDQEGSCRSDQGEARKGSLLRHDRLSRHDRG